MALGVTRVWSVAAVSLGLANGVTTVGDPNDEKYVVSPEDFPYFVSLGSRGGCAGAIVGRRHVVTAAHCLCPGEGEQVHEMAKAILADGTKKTPTAAYFNPACKFHCKKDASILSPCDVAVLTFDEDIAAISDTVQPYRWNDEVGKEITILGYGLTGDTEKGKCKQQPDGKMRRAKNFVTKVEGKRQSDGRRGGLMKYTMDEDSELELKGMAQDGDSGGPAIIRRGGVQYVAGVNNGGGNCGYGAVDAYTRISPHAHFIKKAMDPKSKMDPEHDFTQDDSDYQEDPEDNDHEEDPAGYEGDDERKFQLGPVEALHAPRGTQALTVALVGGASVVGAALAFVSIRYKARLAPDLANAPSQLLQVEEESAE